MPRDTTVIKAATGEWHWMLKMTTAKPWLLRHRRHHLRKIRGIHEKQGLRSPFPVHYTTGFFANSFPLCAWATFASDNVNKMTTNCICFGILFWTLKYPLNFLNSLDSLNSLETPSLLVSTCGQYTYLLLFCPSLLFKRRYGVDSRFRPSVVLSSVMKVVVGSTFGQLCFPRLCRGRLLRGGVNDTYAVKGEVWPLYTTLYKGKGSGNIIRPICHWKERVFQIAKAMHSIM